MKGIKRKPRDFTYGTNDIVKVTKHTTYKELFAYNLVKLLKKYNITSAELSRKIEVSAPLVQLWRAGAVPNEIHFKELCILFENEYADYFKK